LALEEQVKRIPTWKSQLENYKGQVLSLSTQVHSLTIAIEERDKENSQLKKELENAREALRQSKEMTKLDQSMKETEDHRFVYPMEHLVVSSSNAKENNDDDDDDDDEQEEFHLDAVADLRLKERVLRLEQGNKSLLESLRRMESVQYESSSSSSLLFSEKEKTTNAELLLELQHQLDNEKLQNAKYAKELESMRRELKEKTENHRENESNFAQMQKPYQTLSENYEKSVSLVKNLQNVLLKERHTISEISKQLKSSIEKNAELMSEKTKLEGYLRTAKKMLQDEREKSKDALEIESQRNRKQYEQVIESLKRQIKDKEEEVLIIKKLLEESKGNSDREQRLISSAMYEMGLELQRLRIQKPNNIPIKGLPSSSINSTATHSPKSLLGQKREKIEN